MNRRVLVVRALSLALSLALAPRAAAAQSGSIDAALLREVQIKLTNGATHRGVLLSISGDAAVIRDRGREHAYPLVQVESIVRRTRQVRNGALLGAVIGAGAGLVILACEPGVNDDCPSPHSWWYLDAPVGAGIGAAVGAIVGKIRNSSEKYTVYRRPKASARLDFAPVVRPGVRGLRVAIRW